MKRKISIEKLRLNDGQIPGLPKNPRFIKDEKYRQLVKSIKDDPEMLDLRELLIYEHDEYYVVVGGNMRLRVLQELEYKEAPCKIIPPGTPPEKLRAIAIKDNIAYGEEDWGMLEEDWDEDELREWGLDVPWDKRIDSLEDGEQIEVEQSVQIEPPKEYVMIIAEPNSEEWEDLKEFLKLKIVRRGGYKKGSAFDAMSLERVIKWSEFKNRINDVGGDTK